MTESTTPPTDTKKKFNSNWVYIPILILLLSIGAYYRLVGLDWDEDQNLHPDERFLTMVVTSIEPVDSLKEYWNTSESTLNPHNVGYNFFVYGTLPIYTVRYVGKGIENFCERPDLVFDKILFGAWIEKTCETFSPYNWNTANLIGRQLSAMADLAAIVVVFLIAARLYNKKVGIIAAAFSTFTVLNIQLSHFFAVDTFLNFFTLLSIYIAVLIATREEKEGESPFMLSTFILFGIAFGMALASKITAAPVALVLPLATLIRLLKLKPIERYETAGRVIGYLTAAAFVSLLIFRIFNPNAFYGPGFFDLKPAGVEAESFLENIFNKNWLSSLRELNNQISGDSDAPPSIQWARRPMWFSLQNMVTWGMGLPMGIMAWAGFLWAGLRMLGGKWRKHAVLWFWTGGYFIWQSIASNPTMRYQIPIYGPLAIFAGWAVVNLWGAAKKYVHKPNFGKILRPATFIISVISLGLTVLWATAFIQIYQRPVTRVEASRWIYQNIPGPLNLTIETDDEPYHQPLSFPYYLVIRPDQPFQTSFIPKVEGTLSEIYLHRVKPPTEDRSLTLWIADAETPDAPLMTTSQEIKFETGLSESIHDLTFLPNPPLTFLPDKEYLVRVSVSPGQGETVLQDMQLHATSSQGETVYTLAVYQAIVTTDLHYETTFNVPESASLDNVYLSYSFSTEENPEQQNLSLVLSTTPDYSEFLATGDVEIDLSTEENGYTVELSQPVDMFLDKTYYLKVNMETEGGEAVLLGSAIAVEEPWDDGLPLRTGGYDGYGGIYKSDNHSLFMYGTDNQDKLETYLSVLETTDYIAISSSRQWASTTRIPERFPMNIIFYRDLLGCPEEKTIEWCYNVADVGMFQGDLGFDLVKTSQSNPNLGDFEINDQFSEEAFTVYDHPKVLIFQKRADYDHEHITEILSAVDFSKVIHLTPKKAGDYKDLLLPSARLEEQQAGGSWADIFDINALINRSQPVAVIVWYLALAVLGLAMYPLLRLAFSGLHDRGYPMARSAGLLILAYLSWLAGSAGISFNALTITSVFLLIVILGVWQGYRQREELKAEWEQKRGYFLKVEILFLAFFLLSLLVRFGNPDIWHPFKGGEKPMDFAYLNAIIKSTSFPPYDPWFAGGYINYYYYGFVYVGVLVKMLGIVPAVAYNLIIPTLFAMFSMGAFSIGWNLFQAAKETIQKSSWWVGISAAIGAGLLGNLGTLRMIFRGFQQVGAAGAYDQTANFFTKWGWAASGFLERLSGNQFLYGIGEWYWNPSRVINTPYNDFDVEPITEFPWFTFIYADLHPHMISLPITLLAIGWVLSVVLSKGWANTSRWQIAWSLLFGAIAIGALRPTNTWDLPTYLALGIVGLIYALTRFYQPLPGEKKKLIQGNAKKGLVILGAVGLLTILAYKVLYLPFDFWNSQPYGTIKPWTEETTSIMDYLTHWGVFLFIFTTWLVWETRQWMATTPLSSLRKLEKHIPALIFLPIFSLILFVVLFSEGILIHLLALPLALWSAIMLFRPGLPDSKRIVLFLIGTGLFLTMMVEYIVLEGDIGRMNTVFKFYLQVWVMFAICSAAALGWIFEEIKQWSFGWRFFWLAGLIPLIGVASLFPMIGTSAKIRDRTSENAPHTLDGLKFMTIGEYWDEGPIELNQDLKAIKWLQQNVEGSPVIVEANTPIYHWGSRITNYTGLPSVLGWEWHQIQQRGFTTNVQSRREEIIQFYVTTDITYAKDFLATYNVQYIILGQLERNYYPGSGLDKFDEFNTMLWEEVYREGDYVIYKVFQEAISVE